MSDYEENQEGQSANQNRDQQKRPKHEVIRDGNVKSTIFRNESRHGEFTTAKFSKIYHDEHGTIRETNNFTADEVLKLGVVARKSYDRMGEMRREQFLKQRKSKAHQQDRDNREPDR